jgi:ubiquinone/menaquinone biosynthesis C-methylase UbiE
VEYEVRRNVTPSLTEDDGDRSPTTKAVTGNRTPKNIAMSTIQQDFDRIAVVSTASEDGATHNDHYHNFLLRQLPSNCHNVLEIGCGTGAFARRLAERSEQVLALDLSPEMIRLARERSAQFTNIEFQLADVRDVQLDFETFDCIASIATLHHLPLAEMLLKMKAALKPGGVLLILDLFEPVGLLDSLSNLVATPVSVTLRLIHHGRLLPRREVRDAWAAHEAHDLYPTMSEVQELCHELLPGAKIRKHLLWRYSIVWEKAE